MGSPTIFGNPILGQAKSHILADVGTALLQIKNARGLTLADMGEVIGRVDDMVAKYIAGETEMGFVTWERAKQAWPELADRIAESAAERDLRSKQRSLDLNLTRQREKSQ